MKKLMKMARGALCLALCVAGAWVAQADYTETISYLEPVFDMTGAVIRYEPKSHIAIVKGGGTGGADLNYSDWFAVKDSFESTGLVRITGNVNIILCNGATMKVNTGKKKHQGLLVEEGATLTIYAQSTDENTMGKLEVYGGDYSSAIGSGSSDGITSGKITINGGKITANGGSNGAGIGGGKKGKGNDITINGGVVTATGGSDAAGIGGGNTACGTNISINGGKVTATGGSYGAGIGGGDECNGENITISGGTVTATGGKCAAGIGGGKYGDSNLIEIVGGTVTATGGENGAGIGGGEFGDGEKITLYSGLVTATGGEKAAGIGGGRLGCGKGITIKAATVAASGGIKGAGIGGGSGEAMIGSGVSLYGDGEGGNITISGGTVTATGGEKAAGIGGGMYSAGWNIAVSGGVVRANGGIKGGAGIGGGCNGACYSVNITGGRVKAIAGGSQEANSDGDPIDTWEDAEANDTVSRGMDIGSGGTLTKFSTSNWSTVQDILKYISKPRATKLVLRGLQYYLKVVKYIVTEARKNKESHVAWKIGISGGTVEASLIGGMRGEDRADEQVVVTGGSLLNAGSTYGLFDNNHTKLYCVDFCEKMFSPADLKIPDYGTIDLYPSTEDGESTVFLWLPDGWSKEITLNGQKYWMTVKVINKGDQENEDVVYTLSSVTVNDTHVSAGSGEGWTYDENNVLTLSEARDYKISGVDSGAMRIEVTANANITLDNLTLPLEKDASAIDFTSGATDAKLTLVGQNKIYSQNGHSAVSIQSQAKVTLSGTGSLVGGKSAGANSRAFYVSSGGNMIMSSGMIRDYGTLSEGGGVACIGKFTMDGGTIRNCTASRGGGLYNCGICFLSGIFTATINGGTITSCSADQGGAVYNDGKRNLFSSVQIKGGTFSGCVATSGGGALFNNGTAVSVCGGVFLGNSSAGCGNFCYAGTDKAVTVYGGLFSADPTSSAESCGSIALQGDAVSTKVSNGRHVVGTGVKSLHGELTSGTYTFDPREGEYADAGLTVRDGCLVLKVQGADPEAYTVCEGDADFRVNGTRIREGPGEGWSFDETKGELVLSNAMDYVLTGYCNEPYSVSVYSREGPIHITLSGVSIHAGNLGRPVFYIGWQSDVTITLCGSNEVYTTDGNAAIYSHIAAGLRIDGKGELWGGKSVNANCRGVHVECGAFEMNGGAICGYSYNGNGGAIYQNIATVTINGGKISGNSANAGAAIYNEHGVTVIRGGAFTSNHANDMGGCIYSYIESYSRYTRIYGGYFADNTAGNGCNLYYGNDSGSTHLDGYLFGGVFAADPMTAVESGTWLYLQGGATVNQVGNLYVVGKGVESERSQLTGGTYWFDPTADEYAAAGLVCASYSTSVPQGTDPETYAVQKLAEFRVNGVKLVDCKGEGWSVIQEGATAGRVILSNATDYVLTGFADLTLTVDVLSNATVTLDGIRIRANQPERDIFRVFGTNTTFVLSGTNTVYANDGNAAIGVTAGAKLTVESVEGVEKVEGALVGGRTSGVNGRCFNVNGELVLEGGTIRDYYVAEPERGAGANIASSGCVTMNGGSITNNASSGFGGGIFNLGSLTINGGAISGNSAQYNDGGAIWNGGTAVVNDGVIANNTANFFGGAILNDGGTFTLNGGELTGNAIVTHDDWFGGTVFGVYDGDVIINGGWIHDNNTTTEYAISAHKDGSADHAAVNVYGGVFQEGKYFLRYNSQATIQIFGCVCSSQLQTGYLASGYSEQSIDVAKAGWYAIAQSGTVSSTADGLTGGTYTFNPTDDEYAAVGVAIAPEHIVTAQGTEPETYVVDWNKTGFTVDGTDVVVGSGTGWSFDETSGLVTINDANQHVLSGQNTRGEFDLHVTIDAAASVILSNVTISTTANVPLTANAAGVKILLAGTSTLTAPDQKAGIACPSGKDVTIDLADADANDDSAVLNVQGGYYSSAIGNNWYQKTGAITIDGGTVNATAGFDGSAIGSARDAGCAGVTIKGGIVRATANGNAAAIGAGFRTSCDFVRITGGRVTTTSSGDQIGIGYRRDSHNWSSCPTVTIEGGTVVAETIKASTSVTINGGSVKAACTPNPITTYGDFNGQTVWCVTFPDVTNAVTSLEFTKPSYSYGCKDVYPIDGEVYVWLPNYANSYKMAVNGQCEKEEYYYADVYNAPTIAYHKDSSTIKLYVNEVQVGLDGGTGWTYDGSVLTLDAAATNSYAITGTEMDGRVRIVVTGSCDVEFTGQLGYDSENDNYTHDHLITFAEGITNNLTFSDSTAFKPYPDYEAVCVKSGTLVNIYGSGTVYNFKVKIEGTGKIAMEDPTTLTYTTQASAEAAANTIQPRASEYAFPGIDQDAYATRIKAVAVETSTPGMWTLDYQISAQGTNDIRNAISAVEVGSSIVESLTNDTPSATFTPIPGFYYGMPGSTEVDGVEDASVPFWYGGQQDEEITVEGETFTDTDKAFYQIRATLNP